MRYLFFLLICVKTLQCSQLKPGEYEIRNRQGRIIAFNAPTFLQYLKEKYKPQPIIPVQTKDALCQAIQQSKFKKNNRRHQQRINKAAQEAAQEKIRQQELALYNKRNQYYQQISALSQKHANLIQVIQSTGINHDLALVQLEQERSRLIVWTWLYLDLD